MSEYLRGVVQVPIEPKFLHNARRWAEAVTGRYRAEIRIDTALSYIVIKPAEGITVDELLKLRDMAEAIALGFPPEEALKLENEGYRLEYIDLKEHVGRQHMSRVKARIIGEGGRAKTTIESLAGVKIVVGDRYVGILGKAEAVEVAREALLMLIGGKKHGTIYKYIQRAVRDLT
ncbi:KH, type 1, domain protein [Thermoproteus uzoniensis 768-20]|uniref:KH, type 1, domain protein n=1 Tax=Thermoproteus uzoniensis (strain 768-20) TaxID=999630 RepID=F2L2S4_THEU7|nr:KH domain-containing protein [Thermoproteus uzoniensis]AEA11862.1 KH, type 1, domain protein [Thermoproteus uzoniensis 768-20]